MNQRAKNIPEEERAILINYIRQADPYYEFTNFSFFSDKDLLFLIEKIKIKKEKEK